MLLHYSNDLRLGLGSHLRDILLLHCANNHHPHQWMSHMDGAATAPTSQRASPDGARATARPNCAPNATVESVDTDGSLAYSLHS